jgi:hypothetical protein
VSVLRLILRLLSTLSTHAEHKSLFDQTVEIVTPMLRLSDPIDISSALPAIEPFLHLNRTTTTLSFAFTEPNDDKWSKEYPSSVNYRSYAFPDFAQSYLVSPDMSFTSKSIDWSQIVRVMLGNEK